LFNVYEEHRQRDRRRGEKHEENERERDRQTDREAIPSVAFLFNNRTLSKESRLSVA
jgi:hypothetical protein